METIATDVTAARGGAAFTGACAPWTHLSGGGMSHVLMPNPATAKQAATLAATLAAGQPTAIDIRQQYVHQTRVNAGGDGASGPHPEREPA